jgi:CDP-6-deoxy-D-xylo-4-hexulose-3-dehydrase
LPEGYDHKYIYSHPGYNLKITDMQAACGLAQLDRLPHFVEKRKANARFLTERLVGCSDFIQLPVATPKSDPSWFGYPITMCEGTGFSRRDLINVLESNKIGTRLLFAGNLTKQPYMASQTYRVVGELQIADRIMNDTFWVGVFPGLGEEELNFVAETIENFFGIGF